MTQIYSRLLQVRTSELCVRFEEELKKTLQYYCSITAVTVRSVGGENPKQVTVLLSAGISG